MSRAAGLAEETSATLRGLMERMGHRPTRAALAVVTVANLALLLPETALACG